MKIISLAANNVLNLTAVQITPDRNLVTLAGSNGAGKSAVLNSIWMAIGGTDAIPAQPIRRGATEAKIVLQLGDGVPELEVTRKITMSGGSLQVKDKDGTTQRSPQSILDSLIGQGFIDPLALSRKNTAEQVKTLRALVGLDFSKEDQEKVKLFQERTLVNRELDAAQKRLAVVPFDPSAPGKIVQIADLSAQLAEATATNFANERQRQELTRLEERVRLELTTAGTIVGEIEELKRKITAREKELTVANLRHRTASDEFMKEKEKVQQLQDKDTSAIRAQIDGAEAINRRVASNIRYGELQKEVAAKKKEADGLTTSIYAIETVKSDQIREAKFPLDGLSVDDAGILFNGLPLNQASTAEQLKVWTAVAMAMKPKLRVLFIRDGSLLDQNSLRVIAELAEKNDFQVLMEDARSTDPSAIVIESGHVKEMVEKGDLIPANESQLA